MRHLLLAACLALFTACGSNKTTSDTPATDTCRVAFSADSAFAYVKAQCDFGPRVPGSTAHQRCGDYIAQQFKAFGLTVTEQTAPLAAWDGKTFTCRNIIASYRPEMTDRVIICAHWDSRPWADADPDATKHDQPVMAANDGASGVAVMLEIARLVATLNPAVGIDFICFDLEDYGAPEGKGPGDGSDWCMGSTYWSGTPHKADYNARYGVLLDMVGGRDARFKYEGYSMKYASDIVARLWDAARTAGAADYFPTTDGGWITDDHVPMNEIARIPTVDVIPCYDSEPAFGPTWHTTHDTVEAIDPATLQAVGQTLLQLLSQE